MMVSLLLSRVLGMVKDIVMAGMFGKNALTDAYGLAFQIPDLLFFMIAGGALSSAFIPVFSEYLHTDREDEAWHVFSVVTTVMSVIIVAFIVFAWIFAEPLLHVFAGGKATDLMPLIAHMSRIVLPAQYAFFIGGLMFGTLYARQKFAVPGLGPNVYNIGIITGAVALSRFFNPGIIGMAWGALIGACIGNLVIPLIAMRNLGSRFKPSFDVKNPGVKKVFKLMLPVVLGLSLPGVYGLIMRGFGSYYPEGVNSTLDYSNKLMQAPLGIFGQSLAIAVFPALAQFFAQERMSMYRQQISSTVRTVIYLTIPISMLMLTMPTQIVHAIYQHGKFSAADTAAVANCLRLFAIGVTAWCLHPVLMRGFFAIQTSVTPIVLGTLTTGLFFVLALVLGMTPLGYLSLPLASSISAISLVIALCVALGKRIGGLEVAGILQALGKSLLGSIAVAAVAFAAVVSPLEAYASHTKMWVVPMMVPFVLLVSVVAGWVYYFVTKAMGMPETGFVTRALDRVSRRTEPITAIEGNDEP